ncbi:AbrB/MazE/SpoVT family DNA-binding domain-containing protein [Mesorhizobium sp. B2-3-11]|nr:AbrB/MazE/SpoVT family DNA-binding domain-containing protein [Mesorhizobium sp. B2-3-11]
MHATISKWGNSLAIRLPRHVAEEARLAEGACVALEVKDGSIRVTPTRKRYRLADLLDGEPPRTEGNKEIDWGTSQGDETW